MRIEHARAAILAALLASGSAAPAHAVVISGEVYAVGAQTLLTPPSDVESVVLRSYVAEGAAIKAGEVALRIDGGSAATSIRQFRSQHTLARALADKEVAEFEVKAIDSERAFRVAEATLAKARIDADIPKAHLSALDYDRYQGERLRSERDLTLKQAEWDTAGAAVQRRREDARLQLEQLQGQLDYAQAQVDAAEIRAEYDGIVTHGFDAWRGNRIDEGSSTYPGQRVGEIIDSGERLQLGVRAYALDVDRPQLMLDQNVTVSFDALAGISVPARIARIGGTPQSKAEWGVGRYFEVELTLLNLGPELRARLRPGSSARVSTEIVQAIGGVSAKAARPRFDGEIFAVHASAIVPPPVADLWMLTLTQLLGDGTPVVPGQVVATFDGSELRRQLDQKRSSLNEKTRQLERLKLEHAERDRAERIATAEQRAKLLKAERKATQPEALIPAIAYRKLVADRRLGDVEMHIVERRERLAAQQRHAEYEQIETEVEGLRAEVSEFEAGLGALEVKAPRAGVMSHLSNWQGEKFDVGSQVYRGQSVAQIPDIATLAVRMQVPERQIGLVRLGQHARVDVEGGALPTLSGQVIQIGRVVRSRSRVKPVPVVDVDIELDALPADAKLRPGQPVRVELFGGGEA